MTSLLKFCISRFLPLIAAEQAEDEAVLKERLSSWSLPRLQKEGYCITEMYAFWQKATKFGHPVATFTLGPGLALPAGHRFEYVHRALARVHWLISCIGTVLKYW